MLDVLNLSGKNFIQRLRLGFPIVGTFDEFGVFPRDPKLKVLEPVTTREELLERQDDLLQDIQRL